MSKHEWLETDIGQFVGQMAADNLHKEGYLVRLGGNPVCCVNSRPLAGCAFAFDGEEFTGAAVEFFFRAL